MKKYISMFLLTLFSYSANSDIYRAKHDAFIKTIIPEIHKLLIAKKFCKDTNDCNKKQLLFFAPGKETLYLSLYSITDLEVIKDIIDKILSTYKKNNYSTSIQLLAYKENYSVNVNFFKKIFIKNKPFLTMSIKEK